MAKYVCVCGYEYDEAVGEESQNVAPGTKWADVPEDFACPICGLDKGVFEEEYFFFLINNSISPNQKERLPLNSTQ